MRWINLLFTNLVTYLLRVRASIRVRPGVRRLKGSAVFSTV